MTDSTVANLNDISSNGGVQGDDLFYVSRPGTPDADFKADADAILSFVESSATAFATSGHGHVLADISDAGSLAALNDVGTGQIENDAVTYAKIQDVSATDKILGRSSAGAGVIEEITCTAAARDLLDDVSAGAMRTTLGLATVAASGSYADLSGTPSLGSLAAKSSVDLGSGDATGTLAASRFPALSGDVTTSAGSLSATIANNAVTNSKAAQMASATIKGNNTGATANALDLNATQVTAMLNAVVGDTGSGGTKGLVPAPASGDAAAGKYLKADGTWDAPASGGGSGDTADSTWFGDGSDGNITISSGTTTLTRDTYYNNLTISGTGILNNGGFRIFVKGTLDITGAQAGAITGVVTNNGSNGSLATGGAAGAVQSTTGKTVGMGSAGTAGATSTLTTSGTPNSPNTAVTCMGGFGGGGGNGEKGGNGAGGAQTGGSSSVNTALAGYDPRAITLNPFVVLASLYASAQGGAGGASSAGDGSNTGTGGGGGGAGGNGIIIFANTISRGSSTAAGAISGAGGNGGNGSSSGGGNRGGGMGGCGGGGPLIYVIFKTLSGTSATAMIKSVGGNGGNGGNATGTGAGGYGGAGGKGGVVILGQVGGAISVTTGTRTVAPVGLAGGANSGTTGGSGTAGEALNVTV